MIRPHCIALLALGCSIAAEAQDVVIDGAREKSVRIVHTDEPPVIDGRLDDPVWATAARFEDLHEVQPTEYAAPSERTVIYLTYTDEALYVGAMLYDSNAEEITDRIRARASRFSATTGSRS